MATFHVVGFHMVSIRIVAFHLAVFCVVDFRLVVTFLRYICRSLGSLFL